MSHMYCFVVPLLNIHGPTGPPHGERLPEGGRPFPQFVQKGSRNDPVPHGGRPIPFEARPREWREERIRAQEREEFPERPPSPFSRSYPPPDLGPPRKSKEDNDSGNEETKKSKDSATVFEGPPRTSERRRTGMDNVEFTARGPPNPDPRRRRTGWDNPPYGPDMQMRSEWDRRTPSPGRRRSGWDNMESGPREGGRRRSDYDNADMAEGGPRRRRTGWDNVEGMADGIGQRRRTGWDNVEGMYEGPGQRRRTGWDNVEGMPEGAVRRRRTGWDNPEYAGGPRRSGWDNEDYEGRPGGRRRSGWDNEGYPEGSSLGLWDYTQGPPPENWERDMAARQSRRNDMHPRPRSSRDDNMDQYEHDMPGPPVNWPNISRSYQPPGLGHPSNSMYGSEPGTVRIPDSFWDEMQAPPRSRSPTRRSDHHHGDGPPPPRRSSYDDPNYPLDPRKPRFGHGGWSAPDN
eukprot:CAMPEP_0184332068 /NCGR_PEP_ID=MMETSP1089-20130417/1337_1 /TAXON_ID=38269 ORGANISM="Gloeochaete wittrockiana, Strain SAG46.84" /NCGR_SAMPLE_ID=MMETSP1089 /ASSEMBLY_ACC=CAM_ASM_000445 /LENGTH=458 /DNA_ID=CAMNT_0026655295 /DNA_START=173 /DNA_END=1549 /DNA_ORIENTATION=+